jgi:hypothetical protein
MGMSDDRIQDDVIYWPQISEKRSFTRFAVASQFTVRRGSIQPHANFRISLLLVLFGENDGQSDPMAGFDPLVRPS